MSGSDLSDLTASEIVANLIDAGLLKGHMGIIVEQRITAYGDWRAAQARTEARTAALREAIQKAEGVIRRIRGNGQKSAADRVLWAVKSLLPEEAAAAYALERAKEQSYQRGLRDGKSAAEKDRDPNGK